MMQATDPGQTWLSGYEDALDDAIRLVDSMRGPGTNSLSSPVLLRLRAELLAMRARPAAAKAA
jgi:hypothetical protein